MFFKVKPIASLARVRLRGTRGCGPGAIRMHFLRRYGLPFLSGIVMAALIIVARDCSPGFFERLQLASFDGLQRVAPWEPGLGPVRVIDIDDASLKRVGQWPWPRATIARMVRVLQDSGVKAIAFDAVFAEPDRSSPAALAKSWEQEFGWQVAGHIQLPDYDADLIAAFGRGKVVTGFSLVAEPNGEAPARRNDIATIGDDPAATIRNFRGAIPNLRALDQAADGSGSFAITAVRDQVVRRLPVLQALNHKLIPSLALETVRVAEDEDTIKIRAEHEGGPAGPVTSYTARAGSYDIPFDADGTLILHHGARAPGSMIPAWQLLEPHLEAGLARDLNERIVLVGTSAVGLADLRATPLNPLEPGVNIHARAIEQILARHFLTRPAGAAGGEILVSMVAAGLLAAFVSAFSFRVAALAGLGLGALAVGGTYAAFSRFGLLFDPSLALLTLAASGIAANTVRYLVAERDASRLRSAFTHYLSPDLVQALARDPGALKLSGEQRDMTFLFTDLEGFTRLTEAGEPTVVVDVLNAYLDGLCKIAMDHGGTVDKIVGDALHVMFNAPLDQADHPARSIACAVAMDQFGLEYAGACRSRGIDFGITRIGVNTGPAIVGNFGGTRRFDYTAHGDAINTAARLEAANKALGTRICIAKATADRVAGRSFLPVGILMLKGKARGVEVVTLETADTGSPPLDNVAYLKTFARLAAGDELAFSEILALSKNHPGHPVLALHARRIMAGERSIVMAA